MKALLPILLVVALSSACSEEKPSASTPPELDFPGLGVGKADVFGRALAGVAAPYQADLSMTLQESELERDMQARRTMAWEVVFRTVDSVPLLGLAEAKEQNEDLELPEGEIPQVPRWQTWYGVDDLKRMYVHLLEGQTAAERAARKPFAQEALEAAETWNANAVDRSERWPLDRFLSHVEKLGVCEPGQDAADCAISLQSQFSGGTAGNTRLTYSPGTALHLLENHGSLMECSDRMKDIQIDQEPTAEDEAFTTCFTSEFPADAVLIKAHWQRAEFGRELPTYDTSEEALRNITGPTSSADWGTGPRETNPESDKIVTIRLKNGNVFRLAGLHIMTKELRHWVWVTLWWSDEPTLDYGADRPALPDNVDPIWANYKMGVVVDYLEADPKPSSHFQDSFPSLAGALEAVAGPYTWLSNPYIEHGTGNARTNCIGCHQHGGAYNGPDLDGDQQEDPLDLEMILSKGNLYPANGREQMRQIFASDYLWATERVDNIAQVFRSEIANFDFKEQGLPEVRKVQILATDGDSNSGRVFFEDQCVTCHGKDGEGLGDAANLTERIPAMTAEDVVQTLLEGQGGMPSWAQESNQQLADIAAYLAEQFGPEDTDSTEEAGSENDPN